MVTLIGPVPNRLRLAAQGTPVLSTIESIGSPSEPSDGSTVATPTEPSTPRPYSSDVGEAYFAARQPTSPTLQHPKSPTLRSPRSPTFRQPKSPTFPPKSPTFRPLSPPLRSASPDSRNSLAVGRRTSLAAGWGLNVRRKNSSMDLDSLHSRMATGSTTHSDDERTDTDDEDDLWGTPVDADAIAMGLVEPPKDGQQQQQQQLDPQSHRRTRSANFSSSGSSTKSKASVKMPSPLGTHTVLTASSSIDSTIAKRQQLRDPRRDEPSPRPTQRYELLDRAGLSLESSADPLREVRDRNLSDLKLLLAKSIQRHCDRCSTGFGLWVWTWTSELVCSTCLSEAIGKVPAELQKTLVERSARCHGVLHVEEFRAKQVDFEMLARIANALPRDALASLDAVNAERRKEEKAPRPAESALGLNLEDEEQQTTSPRLNARLFKSKGLRKAIHRLAKKSMPMLARTAAAAASNGAPAALPAQRTPPKKLPPPLPLEATERPRRSAPPQLIDELDKQAIASPRSNDEASADSAPAAPEQGSMPKSPGASPQPPSPAGLAATEEEVLAVFRHASSIFVGVVALEETQQRRGGGEQRASMADGLRAALDPVLICTYCLATRDHAKGRVILASDTARHFKLFHGGARPGNGLVDYVLHEGVGSKPRFAGGEVEQSLDERQDDPPPPNSRIMRKAWEDDDDLLDDGAPWYGDDDATSTASDPTQDSVLLPPKSLSYYNLRKSSSQPALRSKMLEQDAASASAASSPCFRPADAPYRSGHLHRPFPSTTSSIWTGSSLLGSRLSARDDEDDSLYSKSSGHGGGAEEDNIVFAGARTSVSSRGSVVAPSQWHSVISRVAGEVTHGSTEGLPSSASVSSGSVWSAETAGRGGQAEVGESFISAESSDEEREDEDGEDDPVEVDAPVEDDPTPQEASAAAQTPTTAHFNVEPASTSSPEQRPPPLSSSPLVEDGAVSFFPAPARPPRSPRRQATLEMTGGHE